MHFMKRNPIRLILQGCLLFSILIVLTTSAQAMSKKKIEKQILNKTVTFYHTKKEFTVIRYFGQDGTLYEDHERRGVRKGLWQIEGGKLCIEYTGDSAKCRKFIKKSGEYGTANRKGTKLRLKIESSVEGNQVKLPAELSITAPTQGIQEEVISLNTRKRVTQSFLLVEPASKPHGIVLLVPGHEGVVRFKKIVNQYAVENEGGGMTAYEKSRIMLSHAGFVVAVLAPPSDRKNGMDTSFRRSKKHATDVGAVIDYLNQHYQQKVNIWGHCRSSLSPPAIIAHNDNRGVAGMILSSTRTTGKHGSVVDTRGPAVRVPTLLVHHVDDPCDGTPYHDVDKIKAHYAATAPDVQLISVSGGDPSRESSDRGCGGGYHGFKGQRKPVIAAVIRWLDKEQIPVRID